MPEKTILPGLLQKALKASDELKARLIIGQDKTIYRMTEHGWKAAGRIWDDELAEDLKLSQLCQEDR